jgi:hypothetical protein
MRVWFQTVKALTGNGIGDGAVSFFHVKGS